MNTQDGRGTFFFHQPKLEHQFVRLRALSDEPAVSLSGAFPPSPTKLPMASVSWGKRRVQKSMQISLPKIILSVITLQHSYVY